MKERNKKQSNQGLDRLLGQALEQARAYCPDTSRAEFGFETRLMASIAELRAGDFGELCESSEAGAFLAVFTSWMWRSVAGLTPVVALAVGACVFWFGFSLPADSHSFINHVTGYLPYNPF